MKTKEIQRQNSKKDRKIRGEERKDLEQAVQKDQIKEQNRIDCKERCKK